MRIAIISNMVDPNVTPVFERLAQRDDCELLVLYETEVEPNRRWSSPPPGFRHLFLRSHTIDLRRLHPDAFLHLTWGTRSALKDFAPDIVVARGSGIWSSPANISALLGRRRFGWRFVCCWESFGREEPTLARRLADRWVKWFLINSDAILACGKRATSYLLSLGVPSERIVVAPHAIPHDEAEIDKIALAQESADRTTRRVLYVGQLIPRKGVDLLLRAFREIDDLELWIVGDGELRGEVETAAENSSNIRFFGHLEKREVLRLYHDVDVLVVPSRYEVWSLVVDEAQTAGRPVVVTDQVGCADDLVEEGLTGRVVPVGDDAALEDAVRDVASWPLEKLVRCAERTTELEAERSVEAAVDGYMQLRSLLGSNRS